MSSRIVVLGNGPSLREIDLKAIKLPSIGMNAAYRAWERLGWSPEYYICLDHTLILSHVDYIRASAKAGRFKQMFLAASILDMAPELATNDRIMFVDQYVDYWWGQFGSKHNLPRLDSAYFETQNKNLLTTGSYAVRWAAKLGYPEIALAGIDCRYIELPEWKKASEAGIGLEMAATPKSNPNYFFDDYQTAGDKFNVPNPEQHGFNLHLEAVRQACVDLKALDPTVQILNLSAGSELHVAGFLPFQFPSLFFEQRAIRSVVVPLIPSELKSALENVRSWAELSSQPTIRSATEKPVLVFSFNCHETLPLKAEVEGLKTTHGELLDYFSDIVVHFCGLSGTKDLYVRKPSGEPPEFGWKSGPNWLFVETMKFARQFGGYCLLMEADCRPLLPNWLTVLEDVAERFPDKFILGSRYRGLGNVSRMFSRHINGNALYNVGSVEFWQWLDEVLWPWINRAVSGPIPSLAYDCAWEAYLAREELADERNEEWPQLRAYDEKLVSIGEIVNIGGAAESRAEIRWSAATIRSRFPRAVLGHGPIDREARANALAVRISPLQSAGQASALRDSAIVAGHTGRGSYAFVVFSILRESFRAGDVIELAVTMTSSGTRRIQAALTRHGTTPHEVSSQFLEIQKPFSQDITIRHTVKTAVPEFRLQFGAVDEQHEISADLTLANLLVKLIRKGQEIATGAAFKDDTAMLAEWHDIFEALAFDKDRARLLLIDATAIGGGTATGEIKLTFLRELNAAILHVYWSPEGKLLVAYGIVGENGTLEMQSLLIGESAIDRLVESFRPTATLYRPVERRLPLARFAYRMLDRFRDRSVVWMMDDWPATDWVSEGEDDEARKLLSSSIALASARWAISAEMAQAYEERYGQPFRVVHNGVAEADIKPASPDRPPLAGRRIVLRYSGGLASHMNDEAIFKIAQTVEELPGVQLEIRTQSHWLRQEQLRYAPLSARMEKIDNATDYRAWLAEADILILAYNFTASSKTYTQYSFANKYPELLTSGRPILYFGPPDIATANTVRKDGISEMVILDDLEEVAAGIRVLIGKLPTWDGDAQRRLALRNHDKRAFLAIFRKDLGTPIHGEDGKVARSEQLAAV